MQVFLIDEDQLKKLREIASRLQAGPDKERDEGHRLWLLLSEIERQVQPPQG